MINYCVQNKQADKTIIVEVELNSWIDNSTDRETKWEGKLLNWESKTEIRMVLTSKDNIVLYPVLPPENVHQNDSEWIGIEHLFSHFQFSIFHIL